MAMKRSLNINNGNVKKMGSKFGHRNVWKFIAFQRENEELIYTWWVFYMMNYWKVIKMGIFSMISRISKSESSLANNQPTG